MRIKLVTIYKELETWPQTAVSSLNNKLLSIFWAFYGRIQILWTLQIKRSGLCVVSVEGKGMYLLCLLRCLSPYRGWSHLGRGKASIMAACGHACGEGAVGSASLGQYTAFLLGPCSGSSLRLPASVSLIKYCRL